MSETLTDEERSYLSTGMAGVPLRWKALRVIDAHAAERAALVAQRDNFERQAWDLNSRLLQTEDAVAELTRERDEARQNRDVWRGHFDTLKRKLEVAPWSEVTRLTEALAAAEREREALTSGHIHHQRRAEAAEARVRELEAEKESATARASDVLMALESCERTAAEWQQTARDAQADLAVLRTEHEKLKARVDHLVSQCHYGDWVDAMNVKAVLGG